MTNCLKRGGKKWSPCFDWAPSSLVVRRDVGHEDVPQQLFSGLAAEHRRHDGPAARAAHDVDVFVQTGLDQSKDVAAVVHGDGAAP